MRLYQRPFTVGSQFRGPVNDGEAFCRKHLDAAFDSWGMFLRPDHYDDSLSELVLILLELEKRFNPERTDSFDLYARWIISARAVDVGPRRILGRNGSRVNDYIFDELDATVGDRLVEDLGARESDQVQNSGRDARWVQPGYDRERARCDAILGLGSTGGTASRDRLDAYGQSSVPAVV